MRPTNHLLVAALAVTLGAACVEDQAELATATQAVCSMSNKATQAMPAASTWTGQLPADLPTNASQQVWLVLGNNGDLQTPPTSYTVYQVDTVAKKVVWRASLTPAQRTTAGQQAAARAGYTALGRQPPPPPWPPVDQGVYADRIVDKAITYRNVLPE